MKTTLRDSILVGTALITILASGFGLGRLSPREIAPAPTVPVANLSEEVLASLRSSLDLTPEQETEIAPELEKLTTLVLDSRQQALIEYYESLLNFHGEIATKLNLRQQKILEANRKLLQQEFSNRFNPQS
ncbi:MAG: hypothetical protein P8H96_12210 [Akkermansiaceae bacterium]|nr:hypothetical protein [Akkermansiaceae bacterium]